MKKLLLAASVAALIAGCSTSQETAMISVPAAPSASAAEIAKLNLLNDVTKAPAENFDLSNWKINLPYPDDKPERKGKTFELSKEQLNNSVPPFTHPDWFFTDTKTGAMVFRVPNEAVTTPNSKNTRSELRAMLATEYGAPNNNFAVASHVNADQFGAIGGELSAVLSVDWVSTSGNDSKTGAHAVVIGQIHGSNNEPLKNHLS